jgi:hypothetical protein
VRDASDLRLKAEDDDGLAPFAAMVTDDAERIKESFLMLTTDGFRLDGKVALITGSGRNIGRAIAECFAAAGW